jgi:hypothetical protein
LGHAIVEWDGGFPPARAVRRSRRRPHAVSRVARRLRFMVSPLRSLAQRPRWEARRLRSMTQPLRSWAQRSRSIAQRLCSLTQRLRSIAQPSRSVAQPLRSLTQPLRSQLHGATLLFEDFQGRIATLAAQKGSLAVRQRR